MDLLRSFARPMLAASFIVDGVDAVARPKRHVEKLERVVPVLQKAGVPSELTDDPTLLTRVSGGRLAEAPCESGFSLLALEREGFRWPEITRDYLRTYLAGLDSLGFFE